MYGGEGKGWLRGIHNKRKGCLEAEEKADGIMGKRKGGFTAKGKGNWVKTEAVFGSKGKWK